MRDQRAALATMHGKLDQIAPAFREHLGWELVQAEINTDQFGSFDGQTPRTLSPKDAAIAKARAGAELLGARFGIASEGTIGFHPAFPFTTSDAELIALVDLERNTNLVVSHISADIFANRLEVNRKASQHDLARAFDLPNHAVNLYLKIGPETKITKGIRDPGLLEELLAEAMAEEHDSLVIESDFRAMSSPSRQQNIAACAEKMALRIASLCPDCNYLGFGPTGFELGLACSACGFENDHLPRAEIHSCLVCSFQRVIPLSTQEADPASCMRCNP